jgi:quercetin dioxygenase-like cupin family protein
MSSRRALSAVKIDNDRVRVTEWRFPPGTSTGLHRHEHAYVIVPMTTGTLGVTDPTGSATAALVAGEPYFRPAGAEHDVANVNAFEFVFVEIELKAG